MKQIFIPLVALLAACASPVVKQAPKGTTFTEMADPTADTLTDWSPVGAGLHTSFGTIDKRYAKHRIPELNIADIHLVKGWRGERLSAQLVLWTAQPVNNVTVTVSDFKGDNGVLKDIASAGFVRYVMTDEFAGGCGYRKPEDFAASLSPDMIDDLDSYNIEAKSVRPVWVTVDIPRDAKPGKYSSEITVKADGEKTQKLTLNLDVINHLLPKPSEWTYHLDLWQHPAAVARTEGVEMWSDAHFDALVPVMKRLASAGQKVITATLNKDPWNVQTFDPYADMIIWTKGEDGGWSYDYTVFDRWVELMLGLGVNKMINCYSIIPWNNMIHYKDAATGEFVDVEARPGTPEFTEYWTPFLTNFVSHLRTQGWLDITNIALDERSPEQMDAAFVLMQEVSPELGIAYADNHKTYKRYPDSEDISIAFGHPYSREDIELRRSNGLNSTAYVCCSDEFPNTFTFSNPAEAVFQAWYVMASGFDGLLRWSYNSWVENPLHDSRFRAWPAGDTYMVYPQNRSSIRFERTLEGVQDYAKIQVIREKLKAENNHEALQQLDEAISKLNTQSRTEGWNENLNAAKELLNSF